MSSVVAIFAECLQLSPFWNCFMSFVSLIIAECVTDCLQLFPLQLSPFWNCFMSFVSLIIAECVTDCLQLFP